MPNPWPDDLQHDARVPSMFDNDGGDQETFVDRIQRTGLVNSVEFIPNWNVTGANTNSRTLTLFNRTSTGAGTTTIAVLSLSSGLSLSRGVAVTMVLQSAAQRNIAVGDVLMFESLHVGAGMPDPGGLVIVQQTFNP